MRAVKTPPPAAVVAELLGPAELGDEPRRLNRIDPRETLLAAVCAAGAAVLAWTLCRFLRWDGPLPLGLIGIIAFAGIYTAAVRDQLGDEASTDRTITLLISLGAVIAGLPVIFMVGFLVVRGIGQLRPSFFTNDLAKSGPLDPRGGAKHAIIGSIEQVGLAAFVVVPLSVLTAIYLNELKGRVSRMVRFLVDAMSGVPSIVAGLLVYAVWVAAFGFSGFAASLALIILMLPTITRTSEEVLRTIPDNLREASLALGAPQWRTVLRVVLPTARTGLVTAMLLGVARGIGETAPMIMTARGQNGTNANPFKDQQSDLPLFIYNLLRQPDKRQIARGYTGALVLLLVVLSLFTLARVAGRPRKRRS